MKTPLYNGVFVTLDQRFLPRSLRTRLRDLLGACFWLCIQPRYLWFLE